MGFKLVLFSAAAFIIMKASNDGPLAAIVGEACSGRTMFLLGQVLLLLLLPDKLLLEDRGV